MSRSKITPEVAAIFRRLYHVERWTMQRIADWYHINVSTVQRHITRYPR